MPDIRLLTASPAVDITSNPLKPLPRSLPQKQWNIKASPAVAVKNSLRTLLAEMAVMPLETTKPIINLGLGDPTGLHPAPPASVSAVTDAIKGGKDNGYIAGPGTVKAREAIADYHQRWDGVSYGVNDIILSHGVGHALDMLFHIIIPPAPAKANILIPQPGFAQYAMLLGSIGAEIRYYHLKEEENWAIDTQELESLIDDNTKAIMITNPSNPCGSNFSKEHLLEILDVADRNRVPIIADEIYGHMTWNAPFHPLASLSTTVPIITLSGLSKRFLLPGWRIGWMALHDPLDVAGEIRGGMLTWANRIMGPSSVVQAALPEILRTPNEWFESVMSLVQVNAEIVSTGIKGVPGMSCSTPQGSLYILVKLHPEVLGIADDVEFCKQLYVKQGLFLMPGSCFDAPGYLRLVIASPDNVMREVISRVGEFCQSLCESQ